MNISVLNGLCYTLGWFWCVLLGIRGQSLLAAIGAVVLIIFQLYYTKTKNLSLYIQDALLVLISIPLGFLLEIIFSKTGTIHYINGGNTFPPAWILCLYPLFSLVVNHSLAIIKKSYIAAFLFGFLGAPLSYIAGGKMGGLTFPHSLLISWIIIGIGWGLFLCLLVKVANSIEKAAEETLADRESKNDVELLYDGECPICNREICVLQKRNTDAKVKFIDISSKDYRPEEHTHIDYDTAMSQMHAVDSEGNLLIGIPAFAAVYARSELLLTSTLLRIPLVRVFVDPVYDLFAKNRLWLTGRGKK